MNSTPHMKQTDPHDLSLAAIEYALKHIGSTEEQLPPVDEKFSKIEHDAARPSPNPRKRPAASGRPWRGRALWGPIGLLLAASMGVAAFVWPWEPQHVSTSSLSLEKQGLLAPPSPPTANVAAVDKTSLQPAVVAQTISQAVPTTAPSSPEAALLLQTMARDLAAAEQGIEQLKAAQAQMARDHANTAEQLRAAQAQMARDHASAAEQLKAVQEQMARDHANAIQQLKAAQEQIVGLISKASEQNVRPKLSALPRPIATATRPVTTLPSPQARAQPRSPPKQP